VLETGEAGKYFSRKIFFMPFQVPMEPERMEKSHTFAALFFFLRENFQLNLFFTNSMRFHASVNHVEFLDMSMRVFPDNCTKIYCNVTVTQINYPNLNK
jgi:hypothetical protein